MNCPKCGRFVKKVEDDDTEGSYYRCGNCRILFVDSYPVLKECDSDNETDNSKGLAVFFAYCLLLGLAKGNKRTTRKRKTDVSTKSDKEIFEIKEKWK
jgi:DNA-directed RNA polymerase subunit RPC12/RpoP